MEINPNSLYAVIQLEQSSWHMEGSGRDYLYHPTLAGRHAVAVIYKLFTTLKEARLAFRECEDFIESRRCDVTNSGSHSEFDREVRFRIQKGATIPGTERSWFDGDLNGHFLNLWEGPRMRVYQYDGAG